MTGVRGDTNDLALSTWHPELLQYPPPRPPQIERDPPFPGFEGGPGLDPDQLIEELQGHSGGTPGAGGRAPRGAREGVAGDPGRAAAYYRAALTLAECAPERKFLAERLAALAS